MAYLEIVNNARRIENLPSPYNYIFVHSYWRFSRIRVFPTLWMWLHSFSKCYDSNIHNND